MYIPIQYTLYQGCCTLCDAFKLDLIENDYMREQELQLNFCGPFLHQYSFLSLNSYIPIILILMNLWKCIVIFVLVLG